MKSATFKIIQIIKYISQSNDPSNHCIQVSHIIESKLISIHGGFNFFHHTWFFRVFEASPMTGYIDKKCDGQTDNLYTF